MEEQELLAEGFGLNDAERARLGEIRSALEQAFLRAGRNVRYFCNAAEERGKRWVGFHPNTRQVGDIRILSSEFLSGPIPEAVAKLEQQI